MMELDKFLDWDGYEVIDSYCTKNKLKFLCKNHDFYLILDISGDDPAEECIRASLFEKFSSSQEFSSTVGRGLKESGILLKMIKGLSIEEIEINSFGPYLLNQDYYRFSIKDLSGTIKTSSGNSMIEVAFINIISPHFEIPVYLDLLELSDSTPLQLEILARKKLAKNIIDYNSVFPVDPIKVFNDFKEIDFDVNKMKEIIKERFESLYQKIKSRNK